MSSIKLSASSFTSQDVSIVQEWPSEMLKTSAEIVAVDKRMVYDELFSVFNNVPGIDTNIAINMAKPTLSAAFATYCTSSLWAKNVRYSRGKMCFNINVGEKTIPVYSMKGEQNATLDVGMFSVDDAIQCSTMYLNCIVDSFKTTNKSWAMTPLARISITDAGIKNMAEDLDRSENAIVKMMNVCSARKAHQLYGVTDYCALEAVIAGIMRTSFASNATAVTKSVATRSIAKCVSKAGPAGIKTEMVARVLSHLSGRSTGMEIEVDSVMQMARNLSKTRLPKVAASAKTAIAFQEEVKPGKSE